jgi:glyoxylase-like metal-dependent hydrolase (beta-lactamase superfamily II)/rhodanese-related sulfurtransferase
MNIEQIYTKCLAQGAYYIESNGEAAVIDPLRETAPYIERLQADGAKIKYIFETHFHADFVSGHVDLAKTTGASIVFGPEANPSFNFHSAKDQEVFSIGDLQIKVLHTPGHTMESCCFLMSDKNGKDIAVFTGDTLFIGDVGRPDLAQKAADMTQEDLAGKLYESLRNKVMTLGDDVIVYPAHGAGSACGKNMSSETSCTIGKQKRTNYALRADMTKAEFVKELTAGLMPPPQYFGMNVHMNKSGYDSIDEVMRRGMQALSIDSFTALLSQDDILLLDTRNANDFAGGFIPGSIFIGLEGQFAPWVGALIPTDRQKIILLTESGKEKETVQRLARVGYDNVLGFLAGGFQTWLSADNGIETVSRINVTEFMSLDFGQECVIDVRKPGEYEASHLKFAKSLPLDFIKENIKSYPKNIPLLLHCAGGYRSMIAASILKKNGFNVIEDLIGGYKDIPVSFPLRTDFVCPSGS